MNLKNQFLSLLMAAAFASPGWAQLSAPLGPAVVTLVAGPAPSTNGSTEVVRRASLAPKNIVVVDRNANADDLAGALAMLNAMRVHDGDALTSDFRARTESVRHGPAWKDSEYRKWLVEQLVRLRQAPEADLAGFGAVRSVKILLPAPR